jgi:hypothetical protein
MQLTQHEIKRKHLPRDHLTTHPVTLLTFMRPHTEYLKIGSTGIAPHVIHSVKIKVDGRDFYAEGGSMKEARKNAACKALTMLFNWSQ